MGSILDTSAFLQELSAYRQFVVHRSDKIPLRACDLRNADKTNPFDWAWLAEAQAACERDSTLGLGFCLTADDPYSVIDFDTRRIPPAHPNRAELIARHDEIFKSFDSYTEYSPGNDAHTWCIGSVPHRKPADLYFEIASKAAYFTVTNRPIHNVAIAPRQALLDQLIEYIDRSARKSASVPTVLQDGPERELDEVIHQRASQATNGELFQILWVGDWSRYSSQSEADFALINILAFYTQSRAQVIRMFRASGLGKREKAKRDDYVSQMVDKAIGEELQKRAYAEELRQRGVVNSLKVESNAPLPTPYIITKRKAVLRRGCDIKAAPIPWIWKEFIPRRMFTMLAGESGTSKSTITCSFAATITTGGTWPDGTKYERAGNVLFWSSEDTAEEIIKPRLMAAGADAGRYGIIEATLDSAGKKVPFNPANDLPTLYDAVAEIGGVDLIVIDPILSVVEGDANAANKVRAALEPTLALAKDLNCSVIGISHFTKNSENRSPIDRVINSQAFTAVARMNLGTAKDEVSKDCVFTKIQTNIAKEGDGFSYRGEKLVIEGIETWRILWMEPLTGSPREIISSVAFDTKKDVKPNQKSVESAKMFWRAQLKNGRRITKDVELFALNCGIGDFALREAKKQLGIISKAVEYGGVRYCWLPDEIETSNQNNN